MCMINKGQIFSYGQYIDELQALCTYSATNARQIVGDI